MDRRANELLSKIANSPIAIFALALVALLCGGTGIGLLGISNVNQQESILLQLSPDSEYATVKFSDIEQQILVEVADTDYEQNKGLMGRTDLGANQGMLFVYETEKPRSFWMHNTPLSLDIIFINADLRVVNYHTNTTPNQTSPTYDSIEPAQFVLEIPAGWVNSNGLQVGDRLQLISQSP